MSWTPLLVDEMQRAAILRIVDHVTAVVTRVAQAPRPPRAAREFVDSVSLANGLPGAAVLLAHVALARGGPDPWPVVGTLLNRAVGAVDESSALNLYGGVAGLGWAVEHLRRLGVAPAESVAGVNDTVDATLLDWVARAPAWVDAHLAEGLAGAAIYWLERLPCPAARLGLRSLVRRLAQLCERDRHGLTWRTHPELFPDAEVSPRGRCNMGLPHGQAGVIGVLTATYGAGIEPRLCSELVAGGVSWLLAHRSDEGASSFCHSFAPGEPPGAGFNRLAWCYGDLGTAVVLADAARALRRPAWRALARQLALRSARRRADTGVRDAILCHGAAGNAHLFNRLYRSLGDEALRHAALHWYGRAVAAFDPSASMTGYRADDGRRGGSSDELGLLEGAAGTALALLAAVSDSEPSWDRLLLTSTVPEALSARRLGRAAMATPTVLGHRRPRASSRMTGPGRATSARQPSAANADQPANTQELRGRGGGTTPAQTARSPKAPRTRG